MRKFKIINSQGAEFDLMNKTAFFNSPDGLGFELGVSVARVGFEFLEIEETLEQKTVSGEMIFSSYAKYQEFARFVTGARLKLAYMPDNVWYYLDVKAVALGKTEKQLNRRLYCPVSFVAFGTWYEDEQVIQSVVGGGNSKQYSYHYNYQYSRDDVIACPVENVQAESPCRLSIYGECVNPTWSVNQGGKRIMTGTVNVTLSAGQKLVVDSRADKMEIAVYSSATDEFITDVYAQSDFDTERFVYLPIGNSEVVLTGVAHAELQVNKYAYTV